MPRRKKRKRLQYWNLPSVEDWERMKREDEKRKAKGQDNLNTDKDITHE